MWPWQKTGLAFGLSFWEVIYLILNRKVFVLGTNWPYCILGWDWPFLTALAGSGGWPHPTVCRWDLAVLEGPTRWFGIGVLGHGVSVNLETEVNIWTMNQSIMSIHPHNQSVNCAYMVKPQWTLDIGAQLRVPGWQRSVRAVIHRCRVTSPDSLGRGYWKLML